MAASFDVSSGLTGYGEELLTDLTITPDPNGHAGLPFVEMSTATGDHERVTQRHPCSVTRESISISRSRRGGTSRPLPVALALGLTDISAGPPARTERRNPFG
jgi:hypothetical protein